MRYGGWSLHSSRCWQRWLRITKRTQRPPEGREHPIWSTGAGLDRPGLAQNSAGEAFGINAVRAQRGFERFVAAPAIRVIDPVPDNHPGCRFTDQGGQDRACRPTAQDERKPDAGQGLAKSRKAVMQPPTARGAHGICALAFTTGDEDRKNRTARFNGRHQRWIIRKTQVAPEPDQNQTCHFLTFTPIVTYARQRYMHCLLRARWSCRITALLCGATDKPIFC